MSKSFVTLHCAPRDLRGKHTHRPGKITGAVKAQIKQHIKLFPHITPE